MDVCHGFRNLVLMLDRFSDGRENGYKDNEGNLVRSGTTPPYSAAGAENAVKTEWESSFGNCSGGGFCDF
ncbi:hypothetical protein BH695_0730 [Microcystis aeruginosa PCC 7806SL]|uniref:Uncharacterized protein n=1 Tax=Microcystis aeruginosa PCC 7806SL TaxID=1903187 RepID=A0AB33BUQ7_MICA7|nr:hypothetical protein BH695_0730 [Microcystis aeruginosa PCC 7806SL]